MNSEYINICLVGCVSAGKSTILNAFFGQDYAQCKIKRTTMIPNKFIETDDLSQIDTFETINRKISNTNDTIYRQTQNGQSNLNLNNYGGELTFYVGNMDMNMGNRIKICIYDIPGLNDAKTKNTYYEYLKNNFHKFNVILFVVDIQSGLNTSDETDILKFLSDNIKKHKTDSNKNITMLTIVNKADDMQLNSNDQLEIIGELREMFDQTMNTVKDTFKKKSIDANLIDCIPICGLDAHLYRMIKKYKDINKLSREHILRIGTNDEGSKFRRISEEEQRKKVSQKILDIGFVDSMIKLSGFSQIEVCLNRFIGTKGSSMVTENILLEYNNIPEMTFDNMMIIIKNKINVLNKLVNLNTVKYDEEMKKLAKQINTMVYRKINTMSSLTLIKQYYDNEFIKLLTSDNIIKNSISKFISLTTYPSYFTDRILELVLAEYSENAVPVSKLSYIEIFDNIGTLKTEIVDLLLDGLMSNPRSSSTFVFDNYGPTLIN